MKQSENFRTNLIRYVSTALTVSLLVTLRVETPCSPPASASPNVSMRRCLTPQFCCERF
jgi:hypothetical protein